MAAPINTNRVRQRTTQSLAGVGAGPRPTSVFSATYIAHELETGHLTPAYLRFYHAMYQMLMFAMNLALLANNVGLMWVAVELATLTTVLI
jgi:hydrogenase-4 component F